VVGLGVECGSKYQILVFDAAKMDIEISARSFFFVFARAWCGLETPIQDCKEKISSTTTTTHISTTC
jgi:hypothetical protein